MEKITRKEFTEILTNNRTVLAGSVFRWNDEKCIAGMENIKVISEKAERRTVTEKHSNYIVFGNGSRLDFNQEGKRNISATRTETAFSLLFRERKFSMTLTKKSI